jgi:glutamate synthase (ferredoxin)
MRRHRRFDQKVDRDACGVGFIARLGGPPSREVVDGALVALGRLSHRGGMDSDGRSGDGAGLLLPIPRDFFHEAAARAGIPLPREFGLGMAFIPAGEEMLARASVDSCADEFGLQLLGWREVPTSPACLGPRATATLPLIRQCFFSATHSGLDLERALFMFRKQLEARKVPAYFCSLSSRTVVYKGLLSPAQIGIFYLDLASPEFQAPFAVFHQRYSTNTRPSWTLAQPFRFVAHNGEFNTIGANRRWMWTREKATREALGVQDQFQALELDVSDSASFDNSFEILVQRNFGLAGAMLRMVPPAWEYDTRMPLDLRQFLERQAREQEPWDGPAALVFSDGNVVGAKLDRNGLRPLRYTVTSDGLVVCGSEAGLMDCDGKQISERRRLGPGEILLVDALAGEVYRDKGVAKLLHLPANGAPMPRLRTVPSFEPSPSIAEPQRLAAALGWTDDQFKLLFRPLGLEGKEAVWSMGDDAAPAFLSAMRRPLWDYCKQRFAQVTNPPMDPLREAHVMSLEVYFGDILVAGSPVLDRDQWATLEQSFDGVISRIDVTFPAASGVEGAKQTLERIREEAEGSVWKGSKLVMLTDRPASQSRAAVPMMLAASAAWKALAGAGGFDCPFVVETGQAVETHHIALLVALGATAVHPYLATELSEELKPGGAANYRAAVEAGLRKVLARMGISALTSYRNSHLFEVVGLEEDVASEFFEDAEKVAGGKTLDEILKDSLSRHAAAFAADHGTLPDAGFYRFRQTGERHSNSPDLVRRMHRYIQLPTTENYRAFAEISEGREPVAVRDLLVFVPGKPIPIDEVESEREIVKRFTTQAMSLGALSPEAHRTIAIAMNRLGARSNTGEGGEDPRIYRSDPDASNRIKQVASARFGVTAEYLARADELEIKMAQGSKPGEGGQLPAIKVTPFIARLRHAVPGMSLISPPPHHDIYSIEDLAQLIYDLRSINPRARIGVKLVSGAGVGIIAAGVSKAGADVITIAGFDGGTGASPLTSIKNTGLPWEAGLVDAHHALLRSGFRGRVRLRADGGFKFGRDVVIASLLGADEFGFGTAALLALGCVMARQCHLNTCPVGIATQDEKFRARFEGKPEMVMEYFRGVASEVRRHLAFLGAHSLEEIVGTPSRLQFRDTKDSSSLGWVLTPPPRALASPPREGEGKSRWENQEAVASGIEQSLAKIAARLPQLPFRPLRFTIANSDRAVGADLSGKILRQTNFAGLAEESIECQFRGTAGQSFGAFLIPGLRFRLQGEANDYVGKGLSGGSIAISAGPEASRRGDVLAGNTVLYGATSGELYIAGRAGERFAVRNSGALAVVEGIGQHGCEYMTAGIVVLLGPAGRNFGSGMTGGLAYMLRTELASTEYNAEFLRGREIEGYEEEWLRQVLRQHFVWTGSPQARRLLRSISPLPLLRLEPLARPCPVEQTWAPFCESRCPVEIASLEEVVSRATQDAEAAGDPAC